MDRRGTIEINSSELAAPSRFRRAHWRSLVAVLVLAFVASGCTNENAARKKGFPSAETLVDRGWDRLDEDELAKAKEAFEEALARGGLEFEDESRALWGLAQAHSSTGESREAIRAYQRAIEKFADQDEMIFRARLNIAHEYEQLEKYERAESLLIEILESAEENGAPSGDTRLMGNPYANRRYLSAWRLAEFYFRQERFVLASVFLSAAQHSFPYEHFCGNAHETAELQEALFESKILEKLSGKNEALAVLLPHVFATNLNASLDREISMRAVGLLKARFPESELRAIIDESLGSIRRKDPERMFLYYEFLFLGQKLEFSPEGFGREDAENPPPLSVVRERLLGTDFFVELQAGLGAQSEAEAETS